MAHGTILGQSIPDLNNNYLALDGTNAMTGTLQANAGIEIGNVTNSISTTQRFRVTTMIDGVPSSIHIGHDGTGPFINIIPNQTVIATFRSSGIDVHNNRITSLANGTADTDAATVGQLNAAMAGSGPQYAKPTGNRHFDFCGLFVILQRDITPSTPIDPAESNCFTAAYKYIYRSPRIGDEMLLIQGVGSAFRMVYTSSGWEMNPTGSIDEASTGQVFFIGGPYYG